MSEAIMWCVGIFIAITTFLLTFALTFPDSFTQFMKDCVNYVFKFCTLLFVLLSVFTILFYYEVLSSKYISEDIVDIFVEGKIALFAFTPIVLSQWYLNLIGRIRKYGSTK